MRKFLACLFCLSILAACGKTTQAVSGTEPARLYETPTPSLSPTPLPGLTEIQLPTTTVFAYQVVNGDTLSGIASRFGVTLEALVAANPGVQPTALRVGEKLIIPTGKTVPGEPTPTPAALPLLQARCWPESTGGLWCFALLRNEYAESLENLSAQFTLLDTDGQALTSQTAYGLLDILPPGGSLPLAAHFPAPQPAEVRVRVQVLTSIRLLPGDQRYLPVAVQNTLVGVDVSGRTAQVSGQVVLTGPGTAHSLWVLATAYDVSGNVIGLRRWESPAVLTAAAPLEFEFQVSSLGPGIARVEFLAEARP
jgi:LysM repeat protein